MPKQTFIRNTVFLAAIGILFVFGWQSRAQIIPMPITIPNSLNGWLWSSNIGWVATSGATPGAGGGNYGVLVDPNDNLSGYAWSPNVGWLSFNANDVGVCPGGSQAKINRVANKLDGFARFVAGNAPQAGGWSGCVDLGGVTFNSSTNKLSNYAWGSLVTGWLEFFVDVPPVIPPSGPFVDVKANGFNTLTVKPPAQVTLSWVSQDVDQNSCIASIGWSGTKASPGLHQDPPFNFTSPTPVTYKITCTRASPFASVTDSVTITPCLPPGNIVGNSCIFPGVCGNGIIEPGEQCEPPNTSTCDANCQLIVQPPGPPGPPIFEEF
jgi:hypothetical protein